MNNINNEELSPQIPVIAIPTGKFFPSIKWKELRDQDPISYREDLSNSNIALLTGMTPYCNFVAFDFDTYNGGIETINETKALLTEKYGEFPWDYAYAQATPSGGVHYVFQLPPGMRVKNATNVLGDEKHCVDIRGEGGLLVLSPSVAESKISKQLMPYERLNDIALEDTAMLAGETAFTFSEPVFPTLSSEEAIKIFGLDKIAQPNEPQKEQQAQTKPSSVDIHLSAQNNIILEKFLNDEMSRCVSNLMVAETGSRNNELNKQAFSLGRLVGAKLLDQAKVFTVLYRAATSIGLSESESAMTINSGLAAGIAKAVDTNSIKTISSHWLEQFSSDSVWDKPLSLEVQYQPVLPLSDEVLPIDLYEFARIKARRLDNAPIEFVAIPALIAYASTIGTTHVIQPKQSDFDWKETPVLWGGLIAPPSAKKTPAMSVALKMMKRAQKVLTERHKKAEKKYKAKVKLAEHKAKKLMDEAIQASEDGDDKRAEELILQAEELKSQHKKPLARKLIVNDTTIEALGIRLAGSVEGCMIERDELTGFLNEFKDERSGARPFYLEAYNGNGEFLVERVTREATFIPRLAVWILGGIQPDKLTPFLTARKNGGDNDGFLERLQLMVMPDLPESVYIDEHKSEAEIELEKKIGQIFEKAATIGFDENDRSHVVRFSTSAQKRFADYCAQTHSKLKVSAPDVQAVIGKHVGLCARIALVFHLFEGNDSKARVNEQTLTKAISFVNFIESHQTRIFASCESKTVSELCTDFLDKMKGLPNPFTLSDVSDKKWSGFGKDNRDVVLQHLVDHGYLWRAQKPNKQGRPQILYYKHPEHCAM
ncbi:DUF3987 domain-containing protein [Vibrio parahaemolyticus]|uniref:DUF3987 domain-containing protein n=1 Tax=Vibrio parahaemolyticus TaxID=670 RepID=UPI00041927E9|nr:DUF3987 domain-containing protein [Vibrio parahaemolyticus]EIF8959893.1 DUF3987 domain-containing protein [Vibrio parahaemolyticus]